MQYRSTRLRRGRTRAWDGFVAVDVVFAVDVGLVVFAVDVGLVGFVVDVGCVVDVVGLSWPEVLEPATCDITTLPLMG